LPRIKLFPSDDMTPEQRRVHDAVIAGPRGELRGPLRAVLHRPELADKMQQLGELLRYRTSLPPHLKELAILVTGRHCHAQLEWHIHEQMAVKAGLSPDAEAVLTSPPQRLSVSALALGIRRIVIDAGHGGTSLGTSAQTGLHEKDVTLDIADRLSRRRPRSRPRRHPPQAPGSSR